MIGGWSWLEGGWWLAESGWWLAGGCGCGLAGGRLLE